MHKQLTIIYVILILFLFTDCIDETTNNIYTEEFDNSALILREIESRGDYINSSTTSLFPSFIVAGKLHSNISNYSIIDIRDSADYNNGHIHGSVNITNHNIFDYVKSQNQPGKSFVIVSYSGQAAAYYTYLFRVYGFTNIYSLLFGIASWNTDFQNEIITFANNNGIGNEVKINIPSKYYDLPEINNSSNTDIKTLLDQRIINLIEEGFIEKPISTESLIPFSTGNTINFAELFANQVEYFTACYGTNDLYTSTKNLIGHPSGTILYYPFAPISDVQSTTNLQTFPTGKKIAIYSYSGHLSAMLTAHLRLLGYDAKSILFGAHNGKYDYIKLLFSAAANYVYYPVNNYEYDAVN